MLGENVTYPGQSGLGTLMALSKKNHIWSNEQRDNVEYHICEKWSDWQLNKKPV